MGINVIGSDLEPKMVEYSQENLDWLKKNNDSSFELKVADAAATNFGTDVQVIACETYLGRPLTSLPDNQTLNKIVQDCDTIHKKFLQNVARQTKPGFKMCIAVPAWKIKNSFLHLPTLDKLNDLGYNRIRFVHADNDDLVYHREGQIVGRKLVVLQRK